MPLDLKKTYEKLSGVRELFEPDEPNMRRIRETGGTENRVGEFEGATEETLEFKAMVWTSRKHSTDRSPAVDESADMELRYGESILEVGDVVERISDGKRFRVESAEELGGPDRELGHMASLTEIDDR